MRGYHREGVGLVERREWASCVGAWLVERWSRVSGEDGVGVLCGGVVRSVRSLVIGFVIC